MRGLISIAVVSLVALGASARCHADDYKVLSILAAVGKPTRYELEQKGGRRSGYSSSPEVESALISAYLTSSVVNPDFAEGSDKIVRINAFESNARPPLAFPAKYRVDRIATQVNAETGKEHLEAFLSDGKVYNIEDPLLQQIFVASFRTNQRGPAQQEIGVDADIQNEQVLSVTMGERQTTIANHGKQSSKASSTPKSSSKRKRTAGQ